MNKYLNYLTIALLSYCQLQAETLNFSLTPESWESNPSTILNAKKDTLTIKSIQSSIWVSPTDVVNFVEGSVAKVDYSLRSGNLIIQANWFDAEGAYLKTSELHRSNSESRTTSFDIIKPESDNAPIVSYRLKIWIEADMPNMEILSFRISTEEPQAEALLQSSNDFEATNDIVVSFNPDNSMQFSLVNSDSVKTLHTLKRFSVQERDKFDLHLEQISASSSFSIQLLLWDAEGTYLGYIDVLKDATEAKSVRVHLTDYALPTGSEAYSIKFWLNGNSKTTVQVRAE